MYETQHHNSELLALTCHMNEKKEMPKTMSKFIQVRKTIKKKKRLIQVRTNIKTMLAEESAKQAVIYITSIFSKMIIT